MKIDKLDILVCGGGYVGLSAALAIKAAAPSLDVAVIDAALPMSGARISAPRRSRRAPSGC